MELRTKKILAIIAFLGSILFFGWLLWFVFFRKLPTKIVNINEAAPTGELPPTGLNANIPVIANINRQLPAANVNINIPILPQSTATARGGITKVKNMVSAPTQDATIAKNGRDIAYYNKSDNYFYKLDPAGKIKKLSDKKFYNVKKTYWAKDVSKAIIEYPDNSKIMYDFQKKKQYTIPKHWREFDFSPDGGQIVTKSMGIDPETRWLAIANADGSQAKRIEPMGENYNKVTPAWSPTGQIIATYAEGKDLNRQEVYFIGKNNENFKSALVEGRGFESQWSPTGSHLLYSVYNTDSGYRPTLWITEASGERIGIGRKPLNLNTWAHKCVFSSPTKIYCAVPENLKEGSGLFPEIADTTSDNLYEVDLTTDTKRLIAIPEHSVTMQNIMVSGDGRYLYYTDANTGRILRIILK